MKHHADLTNFQTTTKSETYENILLYCEGLFYKQRNWVCNLSNTASLLWHGYKSRQGTAQEHVNWAGFYVLNKNSSNTGADKVDDELILGPFQGKVACQTIQFGKGVCGTAAADKVTQVVSDVEKFKGHIACDGETKSEIVVPILSPDTNEILGVIDIDCEQLDGFDSEDQEYLERLAKLLATSCDWNF